MSVTMPLKLYNTLTRERETFTPIDAQSVRLYVCGPRSMTSPISATHGR